MTEISKTVAELVTEALALIDSVTFRPPDFTHRATRERLHELVQALAAEAPANGWIRVPALPTAAMIDAFHDEPSDECFKKWDALLAAVPPMEKDDG